MSKMLPSIIMLLTAMSPAISHAGTDYKIPMPEGSSAHEITGYGHEVSITDMTPEELTALNGKKSPLMASGGINFTVNLVYDNSAYIAKNFYIYNNDTFLGGYASRYAPDGHTVNLENIAPGTYSIMTSFQETTSHAGNPWTWCFVFLEDVQVDDSGEVNLEAAAATNQFKGSSILPNGEVAKVDNNGYDENLDPKFIPGNCHSKLIQTTIYDTKYNAWIVSTVGNIGTYAMDNAYGVGIHWRPEEMYDIMVNDISDNLIICQQRDNYIDTGIAATVAYSRGTSNLTLQNDKNNYITIEESFKHTPAFDTHGSPDEKSQYSCLGYGESSYFPYTMLPWAMENNLPYTMFYSTSANVADFPDAYPYYRFQLYDAAVEWNEFYIKGQRFYFDNGDAVYSFSNFFAPSDVSGTRALDASGNEVYYDFPGNLGLEVKASSLINYTYGNSASINTMTPVVYRNGDSFHTNLNPQFKGLLGEDRESDRIELEMSVSIDGVAQDVNAESWNSFWSTATDNKPKGVYEATIENSNNIIVNEVAGLSRTVLKFSYEREDVCPPVLQALQFRNDDNQFTQYFHSANEVEIILCAGDYDWVETEDFLDYNYETKPVTVSIEIARHCDDNNWEWQPATIEKVDEFCNNAAFGYYFKGNLKNIPEELPTGWYDVRATVTDAAGNINEQIIGPAFHINKDSGLDAIVGDTSSLLSNDALSVSFKDGSSADFYIYGTDGCLLKQAHGTSISLQDLNRGIYIVKAHATDKAGTIKIAK